MTDGSASLPADFRQITAAPPQGWELSSRVVQPEIRIRKEGAGFALHVAGTKTVRGEKKVWDAPGPDYNWVADGNVIRPLPHNTPAIVRQMLGGQLPKTLSFPDVVRLVRLGNPDIPVIAEESVFHSAQSAAADLRPDQDIPGLHATLFPYQAQGVAWMDQTIRHTGGLILADEMGLGKTIQIIALLLCEKPETSRPALIICPTSLIANWRKEIMKFAPELSVLIHRGHNRTGITAGLQRAQVVLSTYDTVVNDISIFAGMPWSWLICDEAQALKNPDSGRRQAVGRIPRQRTIPMTGTPVETSLLDLWSLADLAIPGLLGSREDFEADHPDSEESAKNLARLTDPVVLCRKVRDVAGDLPERIDIDLPLELGDELSRRYDEVLAETLEKYPVAGNLVATGQLQLFCAHPWLQGSGDPDRDQDAGIDPSAGMPLVTPKVERAIAILEEAFRSGRKVLLFAIFNRCGEIIREAAQGRLPDAYWGAINGSTPQEERQAIVDAFSGHDGPGCLVLNPKAAGAGLNITAATIVIHFTQAWNPALESQASARAHRRGQTEPVYIYRLFYEDTVERVMIDRSQWRRELGNEAVPVSTRDADDLRRALSIRPGGEN
ncbi:MULTISPECIES: DEAD/DEAH box helicase [Erythrobacteraceae]|jgi:SNF2 family DNA or RNA helicase|uniref:DEAD/DEAH box helicase n=1 Tax=Erythrobacteraceae TaxID=335929 RepID=UPI0020A02A2B|nr:MULTISPECIES: DEAD/DEAH box helicase [Erythrobacteraceae]MCP2018461.1 SNF2 family DNA or RNA helicase [Qipengyuania citrea]MDE0902455.1 DEAD/DEAH box helicase [Erythrobacter sp.]MEE4538318.1 DEAD/DEAH box helicase [Erythrobacter sp.]WPZ07168.1 DEAD/DEAH box helicase [Pelagerythrobacter marinus]